MVLGLVIVVAGAYVQCDALPCQSTAVRPAASPPPPPRAACVAGAHAGCAATEAATSSVRKRAPAAGMTSLEQRVLRRM